MTRLALGCALTMVAVVLAGAAAIVGVAGSGALSVGPLTVSLTHPSFALTESAIVALAAALTFGGATSLTRWWLLVASVVLLTSLAAGAAPRRVGDGYEYLAMAWNMAHARPPALTAEENSTFRGEADRWQWLSADYPGPVLVGAGPRRDFLHFWLYSLIATPAVAAALALGVNPNHGMSAVNILLLVTAGILAARRWPPTTVLVLLAGPILWWVDKAHAETLIVAATLSAIALIDSHPAIALICAAVAAAQNPVLGVVLLTVGAIVCVTRHRAGMPWLALAGAAAIVAINPLYYLVRMGGWTPLGDTVAGMLPGLRSVVTPMIDPNLGLVEAMPFATAMALAGVALYLSGRGDRTATSRLAIVVGAIAAPLLLLVVTQNANVNHGGTPGLSRYGLWALPLAAPLLAVAVAWCESRPASRDVAATLLLLSLGWSAYAYHPRRPERLDPTPLASWLWHAHPAFDNPLPEIFAERIMAADTLHLPVTTEHCEKVLLLRAPAGISPWPVPCAGGEVPQTCFSAQGLCYANRGADGGYGFTTAPSQPGLERRVVEEWNASVGLPALRLIAPSLAPSSMSVIRAGRPDSIVRAAISVRWVHPLQSATALAAWVVPVPGPGPAFVDLQVPVPAQLHLARTDGVKLVPSRSVGVGRVRVPLPTDRTSIVVLEPERQRN